MSIPIPGSWIIIKLIETIFRNDRRDLSVVLNLRGNNIFLKQTKLNDDDICMLYHTLKINSCIVHLDLRY